PPLMVKGANRVNSGSSLKGTSTEPPEKSSELVNIGVGGGGGLENDPQLKNVFPSIVIDVDNEKSTVLRTRWAEVDSRSPGKHGVHGGIHILVSKLPLKLSPGPWSEKLAGLTK